MAPPNLPTQLTRFIGRERELAEVERLLAASRLVTLTGAGGSGKTRLERFGTFLGLAWGASLRAWMALLALGFGKRPQFTWEGTFEAILLPTALVGAMLGAAACVAQTLGRKRWRWATLLPLLLVLGPAIVTNDFISILVTTAMGVAP